LAVVSHDFDGDGDNDLAMVTFQSDNINILMNNGDGTFAAAANYAVGDRPSSIFSIDLDNDGDHDVVTTNSVSNDVSVLLNSGDGTFAAAAHYGTGANPWSVFSADMDEDGDNDLLTANYASDNVSVLMNNGDGTFETAVKYGTGNGPHSVFAADFDADGDNDLAVANELSDNVSILQNLTNDVTSVDDGAGARLPDEFRLEQNYPNPFNPATSIAYSLDARAHVTIDIYNVLGRKVRTLINDTQPAGSYQVVWDGTDQTGRAVATGLYLYRLQIGERAATKKMILLK
jgi:hypothetical protein